MCRHLEYPNSISTRLTANLMHDLAKEIYKYLLITATLSCSESFELSCKLADYLYFLSHSFAIITNSASTFSRRNALLKQDDLVSSFA